MRYRPRKTFFAIDASFMHVCIDKWLPTASMLCPLSLSCKNHRSEIAVTLKMKLKRHILREFPGYWWLFLDATLNMLWC